MIYKHKVGDVSIQQVPSTWGPLSCLQQHGEVRQRGAQNTQALI